MGLPDKIVYGAPKNCPFYILDRWQGFKAKVKRYMEEYGGTAGAETDPDPPKQEPDPSTDNTPYDWEAAAVKKALEQGIIVGDTSGNLKLHSPATRADVLIFLDRCGIL
jgi:hypothetical protein